MNWMTLVFFVSLLWISPGQTGKCRKDKTCENLKKCLSKDNKSYLVADDFNSIITPKTHMNQMGESCIMFLKKNAQGQNRKNSKWPRMKEKDGAYLLYIKKRHISREVQLWVLKGEKCRSTLLDFQRSRCVFNITDGGSCKIRCLQTNVTCDQTTYDKELCSRTFPGVNKMYIINVTTTTSNCFRCNNPVEMPEKEIGPKEMDESEIAHGEEVDPVKASNVMKKMKNLATSSNTRLAALNLGGVSGILVTEEPEDVEEVLVAYASPNDSMSVIEDRNILSQFSRSVTVTREMFQQAVSSNVSVPFVAILRFFNMAKDERNSTVLGNEVLAVEMGTNICNLTDKISISFQYVECEENLSCQSWNGKGSRPSWTDDGCVTIIDGNNITCQCSHLTFFAILVTPRNTTISSSDLKNLTVITQVGCGLSMLFLAIVIFMHFFLRRTKASTSTRILIHLVLAMFLLNLSFLINNFVAKLQSSVGCKLMAAAMHYFMLATFTGFAVQAFNLCLQLYSGGKSVIKYYILKVCIISWVLPSVVGIVLLILGKYGEQVIQTNDPKENIAMCWITDNDVHYIVNIGYYGLVFLFTFTTFIVIVSWLTCLKRMKAGNAQSSRSGGSILTILGLCCMLGISWGFAFFVYGALLIPSSYIFTVLNSFQGFFLFIYYYNTSQLREIKSDQGNLKDSSTMSTLNTDPDGCENPYLNLPLKK